MCQPNWKLEHYFAWLCAWAGNHAILFAWNSMHIFGKSSLKRFPPYWAHVNYSLSLRWKCTFHIWRKSGTSIDGTIFINFSTGGLGAHSWKRWSQKFWRCNYSWIADQLKSLGMQVEKTKKVSHYVIVSRLMLACSKMTRRNRLNSKILQLGFDICSDLQTAH